MFLISHPRQIQNNLKQELWTKKNKKTQANQKNQNNNRWQQKWRPIRAVHVIDTEFVLDRERRYLFQPSLSIRRFWGKGENLSEKGREVKERNAWHRCFYWSLPPSHSMIRYHPIKITSGHWVVSFTCQKARLK